MRTNETFKRHSFSSPSAGGRRPCVGRGCEQMDIPQLRDVRVRVLVLGSGPVIRGWVPWLRVLGRWFRW